MTVFIAIQCREGQHHPICSMSGCRCPCHPDVFPIEPEEEPAPALAPSTELMGPQYVLGWAAAELNRLISTDFPRDFPEGKARAAPLIVLAPFWCGNDPIAVHAATGLPWAVVARMTGRLRAAGIWEHGQWYAHWAEPETPAGEMSVEFILHTLVAQGQVIAERAEDGTFQYRSRRPLRPGQRICKRCGHPWVQKKATLPRSCPKCKSPYWNTPRKAARGKRTKR